MSHVIELSEKTYKKVERNARKAGVTPEVWIEKVLNSEPARLDELTNGERKQLNEFDRRMKKTLGEMWQSKFRKELDEFNERHAD